MRLHKYFFFFIWVGISFIFLLVKRLQIYTGIHLVLSGRRSCKGSKL